MATNAISLYKGDYFTINVTIVDSSGNDVNLTGYTVDFVVKINPQDTSYLIFKTNGSGVTFPDITHGEAQVNLTSTDTNLEPTKYVYQIDTFDNTGFRTTIVQDNFTILPSVI
jgi:hypothetical protein